MTHLPDWKVGLYGRGIMGLSHRPSLTSQPKFLHSNQESHEVGKPPLIVLFVLVVCLCCVGALKPMTVATINHHSPHPLLVVWGLSHVAPIVAYQPAGFSLTAQYPHRGR